MPKDQILKSEQIISYQQDGVVPLPGMFVDWVELLREGVKDNLVNPGEFCTDSLGDGEEGRFFDDYCNWQRIQAYAKFAAESPCAQIAAEGMGCKARLFHEHLVLKDAGTAKATPWHHDISYYCLDGKQTASIWIALDFVPLNNAVQFLAGSHLDGKTYFPRKFVDGRNYDYDANEYSEVPDLNKHDEGKRILAWECQPGDAVLFHFNTLHGTNSAVLSGPRRAIAWRWIGDDVRFCKRPGTTSPPYPELQLETGDQLPLEQFPILRTV